MIFSASVLSLTPLLNAHQSMKDKQFLLRIAPEHRTSLSNYRRISFIVDEKSVNQYICLEVGLYQVIGFHKGLVLSCL